MKRHAFQTTIYIFGGMTRRSFPCIGSATHTYDTDCDTDCNVCGAIRTITHNYEWIIDKFENCGVNGTKHKECTICNTKRNTNKVIPATGDHMYDNACDSKCNLCGKTRTVPDHSYGDDLVCDECGYKNFALGDIDGTGEVDLTDVNTLAQQFAGWSVEVNNAALDTDGDGLVNLNDLIHLAQYVAGWEGIVLK